MPRILIDARAIADKNSGGVGRVARIWIKEFTSHVARPASQGQDDEFICLTTGLKPSEEVKKFCDELGIGYVHLKIPNKFWTLGCVLGFFSLDRAASKRVGRIDRIMLPNLGFVGNLKTPYELLLHDVSFALEPRWFDWRRRLWHAILPVARTIGHAERLHCVSQTTARDTQKIFNVPPEKCELFKFQAGLPQLDPIRPAWLPQTCSRFVLLMGGSDPRKNVDTALLAITEFNLNHPESSVVPIVLGGKSCPKSGPCVRPSAHVTDAELHYLYMHAAAFLYPSWYEGYGLPLHEANFYQIPILASTAGALPETAPLSTFFCHPTKPQEWTVGLELVLNA